MDNYNKNRNFEDVYSDSSMEKPSYERGHKPLDQREIVYPNKLVEFLAKDNKKNTKRVLIGIIVFLVVFLIGVGISFFMDKLDLINIEGEDEIWQGDVDFTEESFEEDQFDAMHEVSDAASLDDLLKKWHDLDGSIMSQDYVINVLLIGVDGKNGVKLGGNSDVLMLVSINKKTEKITLLSFMRDSRTYFEANGRDYWTKVNATYSRGGAATTVKTIENDYKIDIDYYVAVDFTSFPKVIDALGGVTVDVQEYEQKYINRTTSKIKKIPNYGKVTLDGSQALVYARIRKCDADSDVSRTRRQRSLISAIIESAKGATLEQLNNAIDTLLPLMATNCSKSKIVSYGAQALTQGWIGYEIVQLTMPDEDTRKDATIGGISYWVVDYPVAAQRVQYALYGTTNIELDYNRDSAFDYISYNDSYSSGNQNSYTPDYDDDNSYQPDYTEENSYDYGEETTTRQGSFFDDWFNNRDPQETTTQGEGVTGEPSVPEEPSGEVVTGDATEPAGTTAPQVPETTTISIGNAAMDILDYFQEKLTEEDGSEPAA